MFVVSTGGFDRLNHRCIRSLSLSMRSSLYQISVRQNAKFADDFFQIPPHDGHPCHSLTLPARFNQSSNNLLFIQYHLTGKEV